MRLRIFAWLALSAALSFALSAVLPAQHRQVQTRLIESGDWRVEVRSEVVSRPRNHVTRYAQELWRFAPGAKDGELLHRQVSSGRPQLYLRDDGLCLLQPVGGPAFVCFPGGPKLPYPFPASEECNDWGRTDLAVDDRGGVYFLGDLCVVARHVNARMQLASFQVDMKGHTVTPVRTLVEVCGTGHAASNVARSALPDRLMLRLGPMLLWVNRGDTNGLEPVENPWTSRRLCAFDLETGQLVDPDGLTHQWLYPHREQVYSFIKEQSHNVLAEFEMWAIPRFGSGVWYAYTDRLIELFASLNHHARDVEIDGERVYALKAVRGVYLEALTRLNNR